MAQARSGSAGGTLVFRLRGGNVGIRSHPYPVGPRRLSDTLVEFATGGSWRVSDHDAGEEFEAGSGRVFVVPAGRSHSLRMGSRGTMKSRWVLVSLEDELGRDQLGMLAKSVLLGVGASTRASSLINEMAGQRETGNELMSRLAFQRRGLELAELILSHPQAAVGTSRLGGAERVNEVMRFINAHLDKPLRRSTLAKVAHLSPTRFHYVFEDATGHAPLRYVAIQRTRRACGLLLTTQMTCAEIGERCGFRSAAHFSRAFARQTGLSPLTYREQLH